MANLLDSAARWDLDLDLHIDEELSEVSQGLTRLVDHLSRHPFPGHICCSHGCALAAGSDEQAAPILRQLAAHGVTPYRSADDQPAAAGCDVRPHAAPAGITLLPRGAGRRRGHPARLRQRYRMPSARREL